jgi:hypothetical protein
MSQDNLTAENFQSFALRSYTNIRCHGMEEFREDLLHAKYLKRLFRKYRLTGEMENSRIRLALNHIIIFYNVFKIEAATRILFFKLEPSLHSILKTFLTHLNYMPAIVHNINGKNINSKRLKLEKSILKDLENL